MSEDSPTPPLSAELSDDVPEPGMVMPDDLPGNWKFGSAGGRRPLHTGGYAIHFCYLHEWENQYAGEYLEARVDTAGGGAPNRHVLVIERRHEDKLVGETREVERLDCATIKVQNCNSEASQRRAEREIWQKAVQHMADYTSEDD